MVSCFATILLVVASVLASATRATAESICTLSDSDACAVESFPSLSDDGSVLVYPGGNTRCAFDNYQDSVTGFTTNSTYFFQVFPNTNHDKSRLLIFFQGGGGCTENKTCAFGLECSLAENALFTTVATVRGAGVIDRFMLDNMFKEWNVVFVPYCTGDVHVGNRVLPAFESGLEQQLGNPQCLGKDFPIARIADMWDVDAKGTQFSVMADSYVGVLPAKHPVPELVDYFGGCKSGLVFPSDIAAVCNTENATTIDLVEALIDDKPEAKWLFINSKGDTVQRYYYTLVDEGIEGYPFPNLMSEDDLYRNMSVILDAYQAKSPRITTFYVEGDHHVFLMDKNFTSYRSDEGLLLGDVINEWLASNSSSNHAGITITNTRATIEAAPSTPGSSTIRSESERTMTSTSTPDSTGTPPKSGSLTVTC
ncbi:hypothetical protein PI124_g2185 [Phytophthora idaei]|nr:hypothetical protein PI125_g1828 [Phytophthora idaei]KAG3253251.1 hypothetical protein PI124_g2185 [Phytophthora idaei]